MIKKRHSYGKWLPLIACIIIVIVVFYYKHRYEIITKNVIIQIDWSQKPADLTLMTKVIDNLTVQVKGHKYLIEPLLNQNRVYPIDFSKLQTGTVYVPIDPHRFQLPEDIEILKISPNALTFEMERIIEREIPVRLTVSGSPAEICVLSEIYLKPGLIVFNGPEDRVKNFHEVFTRDLSLEGVHESFSKELPLDIDEKLVPYVSARLVRVDVTLKEKIQSKVYQNIGVRGKNTRYRNKIRPSTVDLTFEGRITTITALNPESIKVYVDLKGLKPGVYARRVKIEVPGDVSLTDVRPEVFTVTIFKSYQ
jgi:YbbR domain-containing protein